jgi:hypothetical protein
MLDVLFVALFQAAVGPPAEPAEPGPVEQQEPQTQAEPDTPTSQNERNRRRCRYETVTGSRMGATVCLSQNEEQELENEGRVLLQNAMRMWDNQSSGGAGPGN